MSRKITIISVIIFLVLSLCLHGCTKIEPQTSENTSVQPTTATAVAASEAMPDTSTAELTTGPLNTSSQTTDSTHSDVTDTDASTVNTTESKSIIINEMTGKDGTFYFGQHNDEVSKILEELGILIIINIDSSIETEGFGFDFDDQERLNMIFLSEESNTPTTQGLDFGDSFDKMVELYGTGYLEKNLSSVVSTYEYKIGNHYFMVQFSNEKVAMWDISTESLMKYN